MWLDDPRIMWWIQAFAYAAFAAFGGFMGHLVRTVENGRAISWGRAFLESASAGFVGLIVLMMCQAMELSMQWTGVIVGMAGWLGASATIRLVERVAYKKLGIDEVPPEVAPPVEQKEEE
jgi:hypothetical protein